MKQDRWPVFTYPAVIRRIYDADTMRIDIDLGFHRWMINSKVRLAYVNAPEIKGRERPDGLKARDFVRALLPGKEIRVRSISPDPAKFGRYIVEIFFLDKGKWYSLADVLLEKGLAKPI